MENIPLNALFDGIVDACREAAKDLPRFEDGDGAIRISFFPQNELGRKLLKAISSRPEGRFEYVARISEGGNFVLNRSTDPIDTYSTSAMNVASYLKEQEIGNDGRARDAAHGFGSARGVKSFQLLYDHAMFALLIVSVDGATPTENEIVVNSSSAVVQEWCKAGPQKDGHPLLFYIAN